MTAATGHRAILFDLDGTLLDSVPLIVDSVQGAFAACKLAVPSEAQVRGIIGTPLDPAFRIIGGADFQERDGARLKEAYHAHYRAHMAARLALFSGAHELLQALKGRGTQLAVVSSKGRAAIGLHLERFGIENDFGAVVGHDCAGAHKPDPAPALHALTLLGLSDPRAALVVGDSAMDIEMGHNAGMETCAVLWGAGHEDELRARNPAYVTGTMPALAQLLG